MAIEMVKLASNAMNTRFELVLHGEDPVLLRAAGEEAFREVARIESVLSAFRATSEIAHINARAATEPVQVSPQVFDLLTRAHELWTITGGAFDVTVGPLMQCWGFWEDSGRMPKPADVERTLGSVGMTHLELDSNHRTVYFRRAGMTVDLGAIGKGYGIDQAVEILRENGVQSGLLHGGTSTTYALGSPPDQSAWRTAVEAPVGSCREDSVRLPALEIRDETVSVSSVSEKSFTVDGKHYGHVMDPRTGWPVARGVLSLVVLPDATEADALSTALLVLGAEGLERLRRARSGMKAALVEEDGMIRAAGLAVETAG